MNRVILICSVLLAAACAPKNAAPPPPAAGESTCSPCTFAGGEGMCMSRDFEAGRQALNDPNLGETLANDKNTGCAASEVCVLCADPITGESNGACDLASLACPNDERFADSTCATPVAYNVENFESCGNGHYCVGYSHLDESLAFHAGVCPGDDTKACVPDVVVQSGGKFTLNSCQGLAGGEGRCMATSMKLASQEKWPQSTCGAGERCVNCYDPETGGSLGVCNISCDSGPTQNAATYANCGNNRGRCVDNGAMPPIVGEYLPACNANATCLPRAILEEKSAPCLGRQNNQQYRGACLDTNVFQFNNENDMRDNGYCMNLFGEGHRCVPCSINPGLPGCQDPTQEPEPDPGNEPGTPID